MEFFFVEEGDYFSDTLRCLGELVDVGGVGIGEDFFEFVFFFVEAFDFGGEGFVFSLLLIGGAGFAVAIAFVFWFLLAFLQGFGTLLCVFGGAVFGVVAVVVADATVALKDQEVVDDVVHETAVVAYDDEAAAVVFEELFEDFEGVDVEVVGRLVEY